MCVCVFQWFVRISGVTCVLLLVLNAQMISREPGKSKKKALLLLLFHLLLLPLLHLLMLTLLPPRQLLPFHAVLLLTLALIITLLWITRTLPGLSLDDNQSCFAKLLNELLFSGMTR